MGTTKWEKKTEEKLLVLFQFSTLYIICRLRRCVWCCQCRIWGDRHHFCIARAQNCTQICECFQSWSFFSPSISCRLFYTFEGLIGYRVIWLSPLSFTNNRNEKKKTGKKTFYLENRLSFVTGKSLTRQCVCVWKKFS